MSCWECKQDTWDTISTPKWVDGKLINVALCPTCFKREQEAQKKKKQEGME